VPRLVTINALIDRAKKRADLENSTHISAVEWQSLVAEQYGELYGAVATSGLRYFETSSTLTTTGADYLSEPVQVLAVVGLSYLPTGATGERQPLQELMIQEVPRFSGQTGSIARFFAVIDDRVYLYPKPPAGQSYELLYVPQATDYNDPADPDQFIDVVTPDGEAFLIWGTAVKALSKSESDVRLAIAEREAARQRLEHWATLRSMTQPRRRVVDDLVAHPWDPADWGPRW